MKIALYLDEDAQDDDMVHALLLRGVDVVRSWDCGMRHRADEDQLMMALSSGRVLFSFNIRDYLRIHTEWMIQGQTHAGIVLAKQQAYSIGEQLRRLMRIINVKSAEEMENKILFLSDWGMDSQL